MFGYQVSKKQFEDFSINFLTMHFEGFGIKFLPTSFEGLGIQVSTKQF
jgi:hypothetical protein